MSFKAHQLLSQAHNRDAAPAEPRPVVIVVEENLVALSSAGIDSPSTIIEEVVSSMDAQGGEEVPPPPRRADRRRNAPLWAAAAGIAGVLAILASAAPFSTPIRKSPIQPVSSQSPASPSVHVPVTSPSHRHASLKIVETSWISACADGKQIFADVFTPNDTREFLFSSRAVVRVGNASGVDFALDGVSLGPLGGHARLRRIEISPSGFRVVPVKPSDGDRDCWNI